MGYFKIKIQHNYTEKCQYANLKVGDIDISGRTPPEGYPHIYVGEEFIS